MVLMPEIICPIGAHGDNVFRVSAVYRGGIAGSRKGGIDGSLGAGFNLGVNLASGRSQTKLSATLAPPAKSTILRFISWQIYAFSVLVDFILLAQIINAFSSGHITAVSQIPTLTRTELYVFVLIALIFVFTLALNVWDARRAKWAVQRQVWNQLYYCFRHDVVFLPGGEPVSAETIGPFLHQVAHEEETEQLLA